MPRTLSTRRRLLAVMGGGFLGTLLRYSLSLLIQAHLGKVWPVDILLINVTGAFLLAAVTTLADSTLLIGPTRRLFINVGALGAYTTFSSLALGDILLAAQQHWLAAGGYLIISLLGGILAVFLGEHVGAWGVTIWRRFSLKQGKQPRTGVSANLPVFGQIRARPGKGESQFLLPQNRSDLERNQPK